MKLRLPRLLAITSALCLLGGSAFAQSRIATVDLQKVMDGYWRRKQAEVALKETLAEREKEDQAMRDDYKKLADGYQKLRDDANDQAVSPAEREKRKKTADDKLRELKENEEAIRLFELRVRTQVEEQRRRLREKVVEEIRAAISAKAKSGGFTLVLDTSARSANSTLEVISMVLNRQSQDAGDELLKTAPVVLYSNGENDLTATVLDQLNAAAPPEAATPAAPKDDKKSDKK